MAIGRTLLAVAIALSVAWFPVAGAVAATPVEMSVSDGGCCPDPVQLCDMAKDGCMSMPACSVFSSALSEPSVVDDAFAAVATDLAPLPAGKALPSRTSGPPLRPPQV